MNLRTIRLLALAVVPLVVMACGGGGTAPPVDPGPGPVDPGPDPDPDPDPAPDPDPDPPPPPPPVDARVVTVFAGPGNSIIEGSDGFFAAIRAGEIATWDWDLGSGATPSASTVESPAVKFGWAGTYSGQVTITGTRGELPGPFPFSYEVHPSPNLPLAVSVHPVKRVGFTGDITNAVVALAEENAMEVSWNFGGGASPNLSMERSPAITLSVPGTYSGVLSLRNSTGTSSRGLQYVVDRDWSPGPTWMRKAMGLGSRGGCINDALIDGDDLLLVALSSIHELRFASLPVATLGTAPIGEMHALGGAQQEPMHLGLTEGGHPLVVSRDGTRSVNVAVAMAARPTQISDWSFQTLSSAAWSPSVGMIDGKPLIVINEDTGVRTFEPAVPLPDSADDWITGETELSSYWWSNFQLIDTDPPSMLFDKRGTSTLHRVEGSGANYSFPVVATINGYWCRLFDAGGKPAIAFTDTVRDNLHVLRGDSANISGLQDMSTLDVDFLPIPPRDVSATVLDGRPAVLYTHGGDLVVARGMVANPVSYHDWQIEPVQDGLPDRKENSFVNNRLLAHGDRLIAIYYHHRYGLTVAITDRAW